jgi:poly-gamma-glutamate synthesis protein (capsule biosynthesis protein)
MNRDNNGKALTNRRSLLGGAAAMMGALTVSSLARPGQASAQARRGSKAMAADQNSFTLVGVGEIMITRSFSKQTEREFRDVIKLMQSADVCYGHSEMNFGTPEELKWTPRGTAGPASYMIADPRLVHELKEAGIDALSLAHNHSFDWGPEGIWATMKHCREAGIAHSGTGNDLEEARAPCYFESDKARVAMVSLASGNNQYEWAGYGKGDIPGRPGMNPLRVSTIMEVDHAAAEQLRAIGSKLGIMRGAALTRKEFNLSPTFGGSVGGTGATSVAFRDGDKFDITSIGHAKDIEGNLRSIDEAHKMSDFVIVSHHNSTSEGGRGTAPPDFIVDFARKAIDAGADIYFGHGWHKFLGIEIYKGKPIVYGMGNFLYQSDYLDRIPADSFESYGMNMDLLTTLNPASGELHPGGDQEDWCWSAVYEFTFSAGKVSEIRLHPVDLGMDFSSGKGVLNRYVGHGDHRTIDGIPHLARGASAQEILKRLQQLCAMRGTTMQIREGVGVITV